MDHSVAFIKEVKKGMAEQTWARHIGVIRSIRGLSIESEGPQAQMGDLCVIVPKQHALLQATSQPTTSGIQALNLERLLLTAHTKFNHDAVVHTEVVGVENERITLMPFAPLDGLSAGDRVYVLGEYATFGVSSELLGRVIDGFGHALDGLPAPKPTSFQSLKGAKLNPMTRPPIDTVVETGIRSIDALLTLGRGQRVGIFAGSGVGKSTLLGMLVKHVQADVNVIALIGERGREVREFIDKQLGPEGLARSVVVVATADQPPLARLRAAKAAIAIAEFFREQGRHVVLTMDSITRYAMARREVGLAAGEPPTARGYTPSVFTELPELCERCGNSSHGGSITALFTVLVEGDDFNEPISDALRAVLDGHIVLSRHLAHQGQYPAIDVLKSASRLLPDLTTAQERTWITHAIKTIALLERNQQMVELGAYEAGSNPQLDAALQIKERLHQWLCQTTGGYARAQALSDLQAFLQDHQRGMAKNTPPKVGGQQRPSTDHQSSGMPSRTGQGKDKK